MAMSKVQKQGGINTLYSDLQPWDNKHSSTYHISFLDRQNSSFYISFINLFHFIESSFITKPVVKLCFILQLLSMVLSNTHLALCKRALLISQQSVCCPLQSALDLATPRSPQWMLMQSPLENLQWLRFHSFPGQSILLTHCSNCE